MNYIEMTDAIFDLQSKVLRGERPSWHLGSVLQALVFDGKLPADEFWHYIGFGNQLDDAPADITEVEEAYINGDLPDCEYEIFEGVFYYSFD